MKRFGMKLIHILAHTFLRKEVIVYYTDVAPREFRLRKLQKNQYLKADISCARSKSARSICLWVILLFVFGSYYAIAAEKFEDMSQDTLPAAIKQANWLFSGLATNEYGESYGYFFQMQKKQQQLHVISALFKADSHELLLYEEADADPQKLETNSWKVGRAFLSFNPINQNWIFGIKSTDKNGFNFKVDMLSQPENHLEIESLRSGLKVSTVQTGRLNGHLQIKHQKEAFVTATHAWFQHIWLTESDKQSHILHRLLCQFEDGSGLYAMQLPEKEADQGSVAGFYDKQGRRQPVSQFVRIYKENQDKWRVHVPLPSLTLELDNLLVKQSLYAGFVNKGTKSGFCFYAFDDVLF